MDNDVNNNFFLNKDLQEWIREQHPQVLHINEDVDITRTRPINVFVNERGDILYESELVYTEPLLHYEPYRPNCGNADCHMKGLCDEYSECGSMQYDPNVCQKCIELNLLQKENK